MALNLAVRKWIDPDAPSDLEGFLAVPNHHESVIVASRGIVAPVDAKLAELVYMLWHLGIRTSASCEDVLRLKFREYGATLEAKSGKMAQLVFPHVNALQAAVVVFDDVADFYRSNKWRLDVWAQNENVDLAGEILFPAVEIETTTAYVRDLISEINTNEATKGLLPAEWVEPPGTKRADFD
jgi:hypothetical protein